ncbi:hypothetical protein [Streptomyces sp. NBC_00859]|uniref:hypothetical protein n=1 Tax=Streptomyces sp. NBC_00859 TaxID=2903682 RepID=UPI0038679EAF|nr:hypothetical protein OG584_00235 [Streptomyces sp. NBC_00859]WSZ86751.1 hypothetical protein OG584_34905 [Streptomyces sp. NBC_00859]
MNTSRSVQAGHRRRFTPAVALVATACTLTACGATTNDTGLGSTSPKPQHLNLGRPGPAQEITKYKKTSKFLITPTKVVEGDAADLKELDDQSKYEGQKVAWVYVKAKNIGHYGINSPLVMSNVGAEANGSAAQPLIIMMGDLSSRPKDCLGNDGSRELAGEDIWKPGEQRTVCEPYVLPADAKITSVTYSQGFDNEPLKWSV